MNTFVDCPKCGSEFVIDEAITGLSLRCPDCLQWLSSYDQDDAKTYVTSYASSYNDNYNDYDYQQGYDY